VGQPSAFARKLLHFSMENNVFLVGKELTSILIQFCVNIVNQDMNSTLVPDNAQKRLL
jgi:hypothetical protein